MAEREFQNMFTFCPGFEAAALKIPTNDGDEFSKKQIVFSGSHRLALPNLDLWKKP
jgi:hypothetical protein